MLTRLKTLEMGYVFTGMDIPYQYIYYFNRPPGWNMPVHRYPFFLFHFVISGDLSITIDQKETILTRNMVAIIPPLVQHSLKTVDGYSQFGFNIVPVNEDTLVKVLTSQIDKLFIMNIPKLLDFLPEIADCACLQTVVSIQEIRNRLEYMLLYCVKMLIKQDGKQAFRENLMEYFREHLSENITLETLSKTFNMSASHIERLSYKEFGCGAIHLFNRLKMDRARILLQTSDLRISEIASLLGYEDQGYFSRLFYKILGVRPSRYKEMEIVI